MRYLLKGRRIFLSITGGLNTALNIARWRKPLTQKQAYEEAHRNEQKLKSLLASVPVIIWATDREGFVTFSEGKGLASVGLKPGETVGQNVFLSTSLQEQSKSNMRRALNGESLRSIGFYGKRWLETYYSPLIDREGVVEGMVAVSSDITEQRKLKLDLEKSEERQRMALTVAKVGHWDWDLVTDEITSLSGLKDLFGREESNPLRTSKDFFEVVHPDDRAFVDASIERCLKSGEFYDCTFRIIWPDSAIHWLQAKGNVIAGDPTESIRMSGVNIDITHQKSLELALKDSDKKQELLAVSERAAIQASEMKSSFLANMSHEIRTPINGVMGMAGLLLETKLTSQQKEYTETIQISAESLLKLINDILDLSKAEAGKMELEKIDFELHDLVSGVERTLGFAVQRKGLKLFKSVPGSPPLYLKGDPTRLVQVLVNLINNAIKFTSEGHVTITVSLQNKTQVGADVLFEVSDTGIGISEDSIDRMFEAFSQADTSTTRKFGGTGLGLSISKHLVKLMGGEIGIQSELGKGSTFWFKIPFLYGEAKIEKSVHDVAKSSSGKKLKILVAEDNAINQLIAVKMLEKMGHCVVAVGNGVQAIDALQSDSFDLVFMDCQMPELDGYEATRKIRASKTRANKISIIAVTAHAMAGDREKCLEAGMNDYISKPMKAKDLTAAIERCLSH